MGDDLPPLAPRLIALTCGRVNRVSYPRALWSAQMAVTITAWLEADPFDLVEADLVARSVI